MNFNKRVKNKKVEHKMLDQCLKCSIEKQQKKKCDCQVSEKIFHALDHNEKSQTDIEKMLHKNVVGEFALQQHKLGVRNSKIQNLAKQFQDKTFFRTNQEKDDLNNLYEERVQIRQMFDEVLRRLDFDGSFDESLQIEELLEQSVFKIIVQASVRSPINVDQQRSSSKSSGSGFLVDKQNRYIVTNGHVVQNADLILIESAGNTEVRFVASVAKMSIDLDIAIIQIDDIGDQLENFDKNDYKQLELCRDQTRFIEKIVKLKKHNCSSARLTRVYAVGYPLGSSTFQISNGVISGFEGISDEPVIQITAPISHGSSGGALLNVKGQVIGVTSSGIPIGENIGFAIPVQSVINVLDALKNNIAPDVLVLKIPYLGLNFQKNTKKEQFPAIKVDDDGKIQLVLKKDKLDLIETEQPGILITRVEEKSIFNQPIGGDKKPLQIFDRLVELDGFKIDDFGNTGTETYPRNMPVKFIFRSLPFGKEFSAKFSRNGELFTNTYIFNPISPEEDLPIRSILKEELLYNKELKKEFSPFQLHDQLTLVRLNSDFISLVGEALPELQQYKEISLIKEPLLLLLDDKKKLIKKPEIVNTINNIPIRTRSDTNGLEKEETLIVKTMNGNMTYTSKPRLSQDLDFEMFKKLFLK